MILHTPQSGLRRLVHLATGGLVAAAATAVGGPATVAVTAVTFSPTVAEYQFLASSDTPPTEAQCNSVGRRCFSPQDVQAAYNLNPLYSGRVTGSRIDGRGQTIVLVDSFGSATIRHDLHVFDTAFGLQPMCGEDGVTCSPGMPTFSILEVQGSPPPVAPPPSSNGTGQEAHNLWALEVSLDVEWAHSVAPAANIILATTPTAETLGVQGFPDFMNAEQFVVDHHLGGVISQSFASAEEAFGSTQSLLNLRHAFESAQSAGVTVLGSSGDSGTANVMKQPVKNPSTIPFPTVEWPASDPLVTGVGGTYLCTRATGTSGGAPASRVTDSTSPPAQCKANPGQAEVGWIGSGGGFSHVFSRPAFQDALPAGSTAIGSMRGVPDVSYQASSRTGMLVFITEPGYTGITCPGGSLCSAGWYVVGGTSSGSPQWAGLVALADQINGGPLGYLNPALYRIGSDPTRYANDFFDVTVGKNQTDPTIPGYSASTGWDPVTGLGSPNGANLLPDLVRAVHGK